MSTSRLTLQEVLMQPIPNQQIMRQLKSTYRGYPLLSDSKRNNEPLVDLTLYGIAGQSYYSRPNPATGNPIPGVDPAIRVRKSIAEQLAAINYALQTSPEVEELFGRPVELYVEEGFRTTAMQRQLYHETFPNLITKRSPDLSEKEVLEKRGQLIATPDSEYGSPSPHTTGAAVDITLRYAHPDLGYVPKSLIPMGRQHRQNSAAQLNCFEGIANLSKHDEQMRRNRRIFYWAMRGALLQDDTGFVCNPDEWWHWSYGDQLWAALTQAPYAFFGVIPDQQA